MNPRFCFTTPIPRIIVLLLVILVVSSFPLSGAGQPTLSPQTPSNTTSVVTSTNPPVANAIGKVASAALPLDATTSETVARGRLEGDYVALSWEPVQGATGYVIYRYEGGSSQQLLLTPYPVDGDSYIDMHPPQVEHLRYAIDPIFPKGLHSQTGRMVVEAAGQSSAAAMRPEATATHGPNDVISDTEFVASVSLQEVRTFLSGRSSCLANNITDVGGSIIDPAQVISNAAAQNQISAWVLIATMEKESSLVTMTSAPKPTSNAITCAMGYGCPNNAGFVIQVNSAAQAFRRYLTSLSTSGRTVSGWQIGVAHATEDCLTVTPANAATAALYTYNPLAGAGWGGCQPKYGANYRFWSLFYNIFGFGSTASAPAQMQSPASGSTLAGSTQTFSWSAGQGVSQYFLYVGTTVGSNNIYGNSTGTNTSATVTNIPTNGSTIYVTLYSYINNVWQPVNYQYRAATSGGTGTGGTAPAQMQSPASGSTLAGSTQTFSWSAGQGVSQYFLYVGTTVGSNNIYGNSTSTNTSATVTNIPTNGSTIYVTLYSYINNVWQPVNYQYRAATSGGTGTGGTAPAQMQSPASGSTLAGSTQTFSWSAGQGVSQYFLYVGTTVGSNNIYGNSTSTNTSATVTNIPTNGSTIYVTLYSYINNVWQPVNYQYRAATSGGTGTGGTAPAQMQSPASGSTLAGSTQTFSWSAGQGVSQYFLYVGTTVGSNNIYGNSTSTNTSATVTNIPTNGSTIYVTLYSYINNVWQPVNYQYRAATSGGTGTGGTAPAQMQSPASGSTLAGSTQTFSWSAGQGVSQYFLYVGTTVGSNNIYGNSTGTNTSATVTNIPTNGSTIYVTLYSYINNVWQPVNYQYRAATR